ncbi:MAG: hypothetical protein RDU89_00415 [bacterium]|nr:hypothetical protein [bacterium]
MSVRSDAGLDAILSELAATSHSARDHLEIAAVLESMGWTDQQAADMGYDSVFHLADVVYGLTRAPAQVSTFIPLPQRSRLEAAMVTLRSFLRGSMFALPMLISVGAFFMLGYSLWASLYLSVELTTAAVLGTILSFVVTGGFTQAIARRGMMYLAQDEYNLARRVSFSLVRMGLIVALLAGVAVCFISIAFDIFPIRMLSVLLIYYFFLSAVWLSVTIFYMLQQERMYTFIMTAGIVAVVLLHEVARLDIIRAQMVALGSVALVSFLVALRLFIKAERRHAGESEVALPRWSIVVYTSLPFFGYGFLLFSFLFIDRLIAWSAVSEYMPYFIWFRGEYELGHDFGLVTLVLPLGMVETIIVSSVERLRYLQSRYDVEQPQAFRAAFLGHYRAQLRNYLVAVGVNGLLVVVIAGLVFARYPATRLSPAGSFVFHCTVVGYALIAGGLINALFMFCLSQPLPVLRCFTTATLVNISVAFVLSRMISYEWAVLGMVAGAGVFLVTSTRAALGLLSELDYYVYYPV